jgi:uncharacterized membrane protein YphA (DoxX/SURF4 family)
MPNSVCRALIAVLCLPLALFFAFVGWNKAFASLNDLAHYGAWTVHVPETLGRIIGASEMLFAATLLAGLLSRGLQIAQIAALALVANQLIAAFIHARHGETGALPQNGILIAALLGVAWLTHRKKGTV